MSHAWLLQSRPLLLDPTVIFRVLEVEYRFLGYPTEAYNWPVGAPQLEYTIEASNATLALSFAARNSVRKVGCCVLSLSTLRRGGGIIMPRTDCKGFGRECRLDSRSRVGDITSSDSKSPNAGIYAAMQVLILHYDFHADILKDLSRGICWPQILSYQAFSANSDWQGDLPRM